MSNERNSEVNTAQQEWDKLCKGIARQRMVIFLVETALEGYSDAPEKRLLENKLEDCENRLDNMLDKQRDIEDYLVENAAPGWTSSL